MEKFGEEGRGEIVEGKIGEVVKGLNGEGFRGWRDWGNDEEVNMMVLIDSDLCPGWGVCFI